MWSKKPNGTGGSSGPTSLSALSDVNLTTPTDGQTLSYDAASGKWTPKTPAASGGGSGSPWAGKKWLAIGDSITYDANAYHKWIAQDLGMTVVNDGHIGMGYFNAGGGKFYDRIDLGQVNLTCDLVTVFFGTNDWGENAGSTPLILGTLGDTDPTLSFYGAVDYTLRTLAYRYNGKPIAVFTPLPRSDAFPNQVKTAGLTLKQVVDAIIAVANKYSLPVFDLFRASNFNMWDANFRTTYAADGLHPTTVGHQILARKIKSFINSL